MTETIDPQVAETLAKVKVGDRVRATLEGEVTHLDRGTSRPVKVGVGWPSPYEITSLEILPRPLAVGDRVTRYGPEGEILAIAKEHALYELDGGVFATAPLSDLTRVEPQS